MNEILSKTSVSEAGSRPSSFNVAQLFESNLRNADRAAECNNAAEAFKVLCGSLPGYTATSLKQATSKEGLVALPDPGAEMADGSALLTGSDLEAWRDWRQILLRSPSELQQVIALHTDLELKRKPQCHARLVLDMSLRGLVSFGAEAQLEGNRGFILTRSVSINIFGDQGTVRCLLLHLGLVFNFLPALRIAWRTPMSTLRSIAF